MGYSPWGLKESDRTKQLTLSLSFVQKTRCGPMHPPSASAGPTLLSPLPAGSAWLAMKTSGELLANSPLLPQLCLTLTFTVQTPRALCTVLDLSTLYSVFLVQTQCLPQPVFHSLKRMNTAFSFSLIYSITSISPSGSGPFPPYRVSRINPISLLIWSLHQIPFFQACELLQICPLGLSQLNYLTQGADNFASCKEKDMRTAVLLWT